MNLKDVLRKPIITEKSTQGTALGKFVFEVDRRSTKTEIKRAIKKFFGVSPVSIQTANVKGKVKQIRGQRRKVKRPDWKKAIISLKEGEKIDIFDASE